VKESDLVMRRNWRELIGAASKWDLDRLQDVARLYDDVLDLLVPPMHTKTEIEAARLALGRPKPRRVFKAGVTVWDSKECVKLMRLQTGLPKELCEAFLDREVIEAAHAGGISGLEGSSQ
jgi:hypothetical protein